MVAALALGLLTSVSAARVGATGVTVPGDEPAVRVTLSGNNVFDPGDRARVHVRVRDDSYLIVLQVAPDGSVSVLFPRLPGDDDMVHGGTEFDLQGPSPTTSFVVAQTSGQGMIYAAVSKDVYHFDSYVTNGYWNQKAFPDTANRGSEAILTGVVQQMADANGRFDYDLANYTVTRNHHAPGGLAGNSVIYDDGVATTVPPGSTVYIDNDSWGYGAPWYAGWGPGWAWGGGYAFSPWYYGYAPFYGAGFGFGLGVGFYGAGYGGFYHGSYGGGFYNRAGWRAPGGNVAPGLPYRPMLAGGVGGLRATGLRTVGASATLTRVNYRSAVASRAAVGAPAMGHPTFSGRAVGAQAVPQAVRVPAGARVSAQGGGAPHYQGAPRYAGGGHGSGGSAGGRGYAGGGHSGGGHSIGGHSGGGHGGGGHGGGGHGGGGHHR